MTGTDPMNPDFISLSKREPEPIAAFLNLVTREITPGFARISMRINPEHLNFHGVAFGGLIMSLADQAFGYAVNSLNYPRVAAQFNIYFLASAFAGDELVAEGKVIKSGKRVSFAEVQVHNQNGTLIARADGTTISVSTPHATTS